MLTPSASTRWIDVRGIVVPPSIAALVLRDFIAASPGKMPAGTFDEEPIAAVARRTSGRDMRTFLRSTVRSFAMVCYGRHTIVRRKDYISRRTPRRDELARIVLSATVCCH
jgi:hypothetical protein